MPTKIAWTDESWNPVVGCTKCSPGCKNCYAERMANRLSGMAETCDARLKDDTNLRDYSKVVDLFVGGWNGKIACRENQLSKSLRWKKPRRIFVVSMGDLFHPAVPFDFIDRVFGMMFSTPQHTYQILTKRIKRMAEYIQRWDEAINWSEHPPVGIHLGVSISTQVEADEKIPILLQIPTAIRWLSIEPMLEGIDLEKVWWETNGLGELHENFNAWVGINWVVYGCESGPKRRPCELEWLRDGVRQCKTAGVSVFVKQLSINGKVSHNPKEWPEDLRVQEYPQ